MISLHINLLLAACPQGMNCQRRKDQTSKYEVLRPGNRTSCRIVSRVSMYTLHHTTGTSFIQRKKGLAPCFLTNLAIVNLSTLLYGDLAMVKASPQTVYSEPGSGSMPASGRMVTCSIYIYLLQDLKTRGKYSIWRNGIAIAFQVLRGETTTIKPCH